MIDPEPGEKEYEEAKETSRKGLEALAEHIRARTENQNINNEILSAYNSILRAVKDVLKLKVLTSLLWEQKEKTIL